MSDVQTHQPEGVASLPGKTLGEILGTTYPDPVPLLDPWLDERSLAMLHAAPGVGKSMLALAVAVAVAGGGEFMGWRAAEPRRVLYVDAEMEERRTKRRALELIDSMDTLDRQHAVDNLHIVSRQDYDGAEDFPEIDGNGGGDEFVEWTRAHRTELVILDNMAELSAVDDENDAAAVRPVIRLVRRIQRQGAAVMLIHHSAKGTKNSPEAYRGSSALDGPLDVRLSLDRASHPEQGEGIAFNLRFPKARHRLGAGTIAGRKVWLDVGDGQSAWQTDRPTGERKQASDSSEDVEARLIFEAARDGQYQTRIDCARAIGLTHGQTAKRRVERAISLGYVKDMLAFYELMKAEP
ncbi:AAA family ATPase [Salinisphaera sp. SPP-AMP-43]|uniref:AAA family ATPase n=1 Tax=Salinisphaera sp. SPP-AMP-43 TaxID=3121288 RepID=UPI003C6E7951